MRRSKSPRGVLPVSTEATELEELRRKLELRERQLHALYELSAAIYRHTELHDVIIEILRVSLQAVDAHAGSVLVYNPENDTLVFEHVVGEAADKLTGMAIPADKGIAGRVFREGKACISDDVTKDASHLREVGEKVHYITRNMVTVPLKEADGSVIGVMQVLNKAQGKFTEEDLEVLSVLGLQAAMLISNARLNKEARLASVVRLIGDISHDIKNMLTPVDSGVRTLQLISEGTFQDFERLAEEYREKDPELVAALEENFQTLKEFLPEVTTMVLDGAENVAARAREIADCIKGEVAEPTFEPADINEIVESVGSVLRLVAEKNGVFLDTSDLHPLPQILVDKKLIYSAVYNLVNNAIPETPEGGKVSVRTRAVPEGEFPDGGFVEIVVQDTGRGMPEHVRKKLFTKDAVSTKPGGTGLGTRIVKNAVDAHEGVVWVESELGKGSKFTIRIPIAREEQSPANVGPEEQ